MGNRLFEYLYFGLLLSLPIVYSNSIIDPALVPRQILTTGFIGIAVTLLLLTKKRIDFPLKTPITYAAAGLVFVNFISIFQAHLTGESHATFSKIVIWQAFFFLTAVLLYNDLLRTKQLVFAVMLFGFVSLSFSFFDLIEKAERGQHWLRQIETIKGAAANKNLLSSILFLCLPFYCIGWQYGKKMRLLSAAAILATLFVLVTVRTRAVLIACLIFALLLVVYQIKRRFALRKRYLVGATVAFLFAVALVLHFGFRNQTADIAAEKTSASQKYISRLFNSRTLESRVHIWDNSLQMAKEYPLLGVGLGNWQIHFPKYGLDKFVEEPIKNGENTVQRPHNDFIWILCETGIFGLLAYLIFLAVIFYQLYHLIKNAATASDKWKYYFVFCALSGYMVIAFFDFPYERHEHQLIVMLLFAMVSASYLKALPTARNNTRPLLFLCLIPVVYSLVVVFYRFSGEQHAVKMYIAKSSRNWSETIYESRKAENFYYPVDNTTMPLSWYEGIAHFNENRIQESEACFEKAFQATPYNIQVMTNLASAYQANGKLADAIALYREALQISKEFDEAKLNLAALYYNKKEFDSAYSLINEIKVTSKNPKYKLYLVPILNHKTNAYLRSLSDKAVIDNLVKNITTKEILLQLFFDAKKNNIAFETYLAQAKF